MQASHEFATRSDGHLLENLSTLAATLLHLLDDIHPLNHSTEDHVFPVQPVTLGSRDEELGAVGVRSAVSHRQEARGVALQEDVFVLELVSEDGLASCPVVPAEVSSSRPSGPAPIRREHSVGKREGDA